jgi:hypothetical protein
VNVIFCAYRDWAKRCLATVEKHPNVKEVRHAEDNDELEYLLNTWPDASIVLFAGWSTPPSQELLESFSKVPMFTEHPAASDRYSPGTPLQNQILDGVRFTKHRLVKVGFPELSLRQYSHEVDMDLSGNMDDILFQMEATSRVLFNMFLDSYPNVEWKVWPEVPEKDQVPRRVPLQSQLKWSEVGSYTTKQLYDRIRCLESPYPNAYLEDEHGRLYFERVRYEAKK